MTLTLHYRQMKWNAVTNNREQPLINFSCENISELTLLSDYNVGVHNIRVRSEWVDGMKITITDTSMDSTFCL